MRKIKSKQQRQQQYQHNNTTNDMHHNKTANTTTSTSATTVATPRVPSTTRVTTTRVASTILYFGFDFFRMPSLWLIDTPKGLPCMAATEATPAAALHSLLQPQTLPAALTQLLPVRMSRSPSPTLTNTRLQVLFINRTPTIGTLADYSDLLGGPNNPLASIAGSTLFSIGIRSIELREIILHITARISEHITEKSATLTIGMKPK